MFKRIFWLVSLVTLGIAIWLRLRQQRAASPPQFAPRLPHSSASAHAEHPRLSDHTEPIVPVEPTDLATIDEPGAVAEPTDPATIDEPGAVAEPTSELALPAHDAADNEPAEVTGFCVRCKAKRPINNAQIETTERGRRAARGTCPVCSAKMYTFLTSHDHEIPPT